MRRRTGETGKAVTRESVDAVRTVATLMTCLYNTVVDVDFTVAAAESGLADTPVAVDVIEAGTAVEAR